MLKSISYTPQGLRRHFDWRGGTERSILTVIVWSGLIDVCFSGKGAVRSTAWGSRIFAPPPLYFMISRRSLDASCVLCLAKKSWRNYSSAFQFWPIVIAVSLLGAFSVRERLYIVSFRVSTYQLYSLLLLSHGNNGSSEDSARWCRLTILDLVFLPLFLLILFRLHSSLFAGAPASSETALHVSISAQVNKNSKMIMSWRIRRRKIRHRWSTNYPPHTHYVNFLSIVGALQILVISRWRD